MRLTALAFALLVLAALPASASAARSSYCSPSGDFCTFVFRDGGVRTAELRTFALRGSVRLCVDPPRGATRCRSFTLRKGARGIYVARSRLSRSFPIRRRGLYRVRFSQGDFRPPALSFRVG